MKGVSPAISLPGGNDTIAAVATALGRGAISVVRLSGPQAHVIARSVIQPWPLDPRRATLCRILSAEGTVLDQVVVTSFTAPSSFTGEDLVEISGHGGRYAPLVVMRALISSGAREAVPGEFTRRAVLNGKLDIVQAEAIGDLVDARSGAMHKTALTQLDGGLSRRIVALRDQVVLVESLIAYDIDFPEEDDGPISRERVHAEADRLIDALDRLLGTIPYGEVIREGAVVVIAGQPNVGKSSLFNALLGQSRAIVTEVPGTTRDAIEAFLETENWPVRLVDTAGLRETADIVEKIGIEVSEKYLAEAHVILACGDSEESLSAVRRALDGKTTAPILEVRTKSDLSGDLTTHADVLSVSAETGEGLSKLLAGVDSVLSESIGRPVIDMPVLTRSRQIQGISEARSEIAAFRDAWCEQGLPGPVAAVHLRSGATALESLIGAVSTEDVLDRVFSSFCIGK